MLNWDQVRFVYLRVVVLLFVSRARAQTSNDSVFRLSPSDFVAEELRPVDLPPPNSRYDFIIVGAGPAGCVLANRLSENPKWSVYLLEAGGIGNVAHDIPALAPLLQNTNSDWGYQSVPQKNACQAMKDKKCNLPRGKLVGGSSGINFMMYVRGNQRDYNRWAEAGNNGWSYKEVLPYFKRSEMVHSKVLENSPYHNTTGPLSVEFVAYRTEIAKAVVKAQEELGLDLIDYNGKSQLGVSFVQGTTKNGHRHSAEKAYLDPSVMNRENLHILTFANVTKILINPVNKIAFGVEFTRSNKVYRIRARKEVILSAGTFNSPQLLMVSGIGPRDVLSSIGVPIIKELPVGKTLYDHIGFFGPIFTVNTTKQSLSAERLTAEDYKKFQNGDPATIFSTLGGVEALSFFPRNISKGNPKFPDIELILVSASFPRGSDGNGGANIRKDIYDKLFRPILGKEVFSFITVLLQPESKGNLSLENKDPSTPPIIDPNYMHVSKDVDLILGGIREAIRISKTPALQAINATLYSMPIPGCEQHKFGSDNYWICAMKALSYTMHHQVSTCKMGPYYDPTSVVSSELKVHGIRNLRVVDTSIMPYIPSGHTNAASFMIGEKAADMIINEYKEKKNIKFKDWN